EVTQRDFVLTGPHRQRHVFPRSGDRDVIVAVPQLRRDRIGVRDDQRLLSVERGAVFANQLHSVGGELHGEVVKGARVGGGNLYVLVAGDLEVAAAAGVSDAGGRRDRRAEVRSIRRGELDIELPGRRISVAPRHGQDAVHRGDRAGGRRPITPVDHRGK